MRLCEGGHLELELGVFRGEAGDFVAVRRHRTTTKCLSSPEKCSAPLCSRSSFEMVSPLADVVQQILTLSDSIPNLKTLLSRLQAREDQVRLLMMSA